jgi:hypothetical protein
MGEMRLGVHLECLFLVISDSIARLLGTAATEAARGFHLRSADCKNH